MIHEVEEDSFLQDPYNLVVKQDILVQNFLIVMVMPEEPVAEIQPERQIFKV